uniref:SWIRM domain-containing protein n=1 Tax=Homalodisca liturata TaxID=320908 RepID=A0A1B6JIY0_9HEMI
MMPSQIEISHLKNKTNSLCTSTVEPNVVNANLHDLDTNSKEIGCHNSKNLHEVVQSSKTLAVFQNHSLKSDKYFCKKVDNEKQVSTEIIQPRHLKFGKPSNTELWKMRQIDDPNLAGYNPFRGDFNIEFNNSAEGMLCLAGMLNDFSNDRDNTNENERKLLEELQIALIEGYNLQLVERQKRKNVIKKLGLINQTGTYQWYTRYEGVLGKSVWKNLIRFSRLMDVDKTEHLYASLEIMNEQRALVNKLIFYRTQHGITTKLGMKLFEMERKKREEPFERVDIRNLALPTTVKRKQTTRQIFHLPRYKDLSVKEAELCSTIGLVPVFYLDTKDQLISDCKKTNGILLKRARKLVKIDVNKTRKIFDLLMEQGLIWPPETENKET